MAKTLDEAGVKRLIQEIKGANKNLNAPIPISTENTPESMAQNVKNIADHVEKAKAAGVANVNGMAVTCLIDNDYSGVGYLYGDTAICGIKTNDALEAPSFFDVDPSGSYHENEVLVKGLSDQITSDLLVEGARKPIILTPDTTEVDEETYQKLLSDDVDVVFKLGEVESGADFCTLVFKEYWEDGGRLQLYFTNLSPTSNAKKVYFDSYFVDILDSAPHKITVTTLWEDLLDLFLEDSLGFLPKNKLSLVLKEIDLTGTDVDRKAKLDQFAVDWKELTGASDLTGARFIAKGYFDIPSPPENNVIMTYVENGLVATGYTGIAITTYNSIIGAYRVNIALDGTMSSNAIRDSETTDAFQQFAWAEVPNTYLKIADAASTYETKANVTETLKNYVKDEDAVAIGNIATANAITSIKDDLTPVLQEIDLRGTDADRKAKLDQFEADWKALTGADYLTGARFVGKFGITDDVERNITGIMTYSAGDEPTDATDNCFYGICNGYSMGEQKSQIAVKVSCTDGSLAITPLFSHLEAITIYTDNTPEHMQANLDNIAAYEANLQALGVDTTKGYMIPITASGRNGFLSTRSGNYPYAGYVAADSSVSDFYNILILGNGEYYDSKIQSENSSELNTISKKLVPAINEVNTLAKNKQDKLTSGTNIKTINNQSLLGSGNIEISAPSITVDASMSNTSTNPVQNKVIKAYIDGLVENVTA